ncbi:calcineurin subunit B [Drosophila grimshawi]|uniref:GH12624 n=1 Tax=Drosophila grimshawi TaxID=7222 RepID=B4JKA9_DROGR|nr:calcineurin subunit B [Drosophila grimshawi]EDW00012.1 GH12624 [Drosophila grimshawi]
MGVVASRHLSAAKLQQIEKESGFSPQRIDYLLGQYQTLGRDSNNSVLRTELLKVPPVAQHPFAERLVEVYLYPSLCFQHFILGLSRFRRHVPLQHKLASLLHMYDDDGDGLLSADRCEELICCLPATRHELRAIRWKLKQLVTANEMEQQQPQEGQQVKQLKGFLNCDDLDFITRNVDLDESLSLRFS